MTYKVVIEKTAEKAIGKMDARPRKIILNFLKAIAQSNNVRTEFVTAKPYKTTNASGGLGWVVIECFPTLTIKLSPSRSSR